MGLTPEMCWAEAPTTNVFALTMHATLVPEIHIVPPEERGTSASPADSFFFYPDVRCEGKAACSNQYSFALHARNLTMLEAVDLIRDNTVVINPAEVKRRDGPGKGQ